MSFHNAPLHPRWCTMPGSRTIFRSPLVRHRIFVPCCLLFLASPAAIAQQGPPGRGGLPASMPQPPPDARSWPPNNVDVAAAVRRAERRTGGQVLNVESMAFEGREVHRVKVLGPGGRVMILLDDPRGNAPGRAPAIALPARTPAPSTPQRDEP